MTIYLSGPMTGIPDFNRPTFRAAAMRLRGMGHVVFDPSESFGGDVTLEHETYMQIDRAAVRACDSVVLLPGWQSSKGANEERDIAAREGRVCLEYEAMPKPLLIGLCGFAGSGKDEVGKVLIDRGFQRIAFADPLKEFARSLGWDGNKDEKGRRFLQDIGVAMRERFDEDFWVRRAFDGADLSRPTVVTDVRFANEQRMIRDMGGKLWQVTRPGTVAANDHVSEHEWRAATFDVTIENDRTLADLARLVTETVMAFEAINQGQR